MEGGQLQSKEDTVEAIPAPQTMEEIVKVAHVDVGTVSRW